MKSDSLETIISELIHSVKTMAEIMEQQNKRIETLEKILNDPRNIVKHRMRDGDE